MLRSLLLFAIALSLSLASLRAQAPEAEAPVCNDEFARFLVEQVVAESRSVDQTDRRIRILIRAAEFMWTVDEPIARDHFAEAFKVATDRFSDVGFEKSENKGLMTMKPDYRFEVVRAIASRDAEWAKRLIDQIMKEYEKAAADRKEFDRGREINDLMRVAQESIKTNPELSRHLYRRVMQYPLDYQWFWGIYAAATENRQFADILYTELLNNYANATPRRMLFLSAYPFANSRPMGADRLSYGASLPAGFTPNRNLQRQFIEVFLRRVASFAGDPANLTLPPDSGRRPEPVYMISALSELEPIVIQQFPNLLQRLSEAKAQATGMLNEQMRKDLKDGEQRDETLGAGFESKLKQIEEADANGKLTDEMIINLVFWSNKDRTEEQFKLIEPWLAKIRDEAAREQTINYFWFLRSRLAITEERFDDADRYARKVPEVEHRALLLFEIAEIQLKNVNDGATVYTTLREVGRLAEQSDTSIEKARVLLALSYLYAKMNPVFAMQELGGAIKVINQLDNPDLLSSYVLRQIRTKNSSFHASFSIAGHNLESAFREISKDNFEISLSNAKALDDKYLRTIAVLAVAKNCLEKSKKKPASKKTPVRSGN